MTATAKTLTRPASGIPARVDALDWDQITTDLGGQGCAVLKGLLTPEECDAVAALYPDDSRFRSRVVMGRHGFGRGEYKYFSYPLYALVNLRNNRLLMNRASAYEKAPVSSRGG